MYKFTNKHKTQETVGKTIRQKHLKQGDREYAWEI